MNLVVDRVTEASAAASAAALAPVLIDTVESGASVGWITPPGLAAAESWWAALFADPAAETWVARIDERVLGTITLVRASKPNGPHRADVIKLMVHRDARGRGVAGALMQALEDFAAATGLTLLVLDTETGSLAESLYSRWGWQAVGGIPDYAVSPSGTLSGTTIMYKRLASSATSAALGAGSQAMAAE